MLGLISQETETLIDLFCLRNIVVNRCLLRNRLLFFLLREIDRCQVFKLEKLRICQNRNVALQPPEQPVYGLLISIFELL